MTSKKKQFKVVAQTDPPDAASAYEEARWGKLADSILRPGTPTNGSRSTTRAHEDHERLKQEVLEVVDNLLSERMKQAS